MRIRLRQGGRDEGMLFTIAVVMLLIPLILLIAYYTTMEKTKSDDSIGKIRCDELHYFVEDVKEDLARAMVIFGRRAAIYAIDDVVTRGEPLGDYAFNCSDICRVDCNRFRFDVNGSEAAITELTLCGTLHGENISYMVNHTLSQWIGRMMEQGGDMNFNLSIRIDEIKIAPYDAWTFAAIINLTLEAYDESNTCYYMGTGIPTVSYTSILGLEDVLYPINTNSYVIKYIENCTHNITDDLTAGCSLDDWGEGTGTGDVIFQSNITDLYGGLETYCVNQPHEIVNNQVLVIDTAYGGCNQYDEFRCFNISDEHHFAGVINYGPNDPQSFTSKCNITIPWISHTCKLDNETSHGPGGGCTRPPGCDEGFIYSGACVQIRNNADCGLHSVLIGTSSELVNTTCYYVSNASLYGGYDGPSFFDRLDGRYNLSDKYVNQSRECFNNTRIGFETLVSPYVLDAHGITPRRNASWVDYLYWRSVDGCRVYTSCIADEYVLRLDEEHARFYYVDTSCDNVTSCTPVTSEVCVNCMDEDNDTMADWLDVDCNDSFAGCGGIHFCDPSDSDHCATCGTPTPPEIDDNSTVTCSFYGFNTTEWHFYGYVPDISGLLTVEFTGNAGVSGDYETDLVIYNYTTGSCLEPLHTFNMEPSASNGTCVFAHRNYVIALDIDSNDCGIMGDYTLRTWLNESASCPTVSTSTTSSSTTSSSTSSTSTSSTSSSSTSSSTIPCGFYDDFENLGYTASHWTHGDIYDAQDDWAVGDPDYHDCQTTPNCWGTDITGRLWGFNRQQDYTNNKDEYLKTSQINLTGATNAAVMLYIKYNTEQCCDYGILQVSENDITWTNVTTLYGNSWRGSWFIWHGDGADLSAYNGKSIWLRVLLHSDNAIRWQGLYIDNFNVSCG